MKSKVSASAKFTPRNAEPLKNVDLFAKISQIAADYLNEFLTKILVRHKAFNF